MDEFLKWVVRIGVGIAVAVFGYFVSRLDKRMDDHDRKDDERFKELSAKLDGLRDDMVAKRHAFRNEIHAYVGEVELRLTKDINRIEDRKTDR